ncbi:Cupredoxin [Gigaspora rosea]|uniref:Cupredoxin n=1 Tax=Gigaspora rosea TaxID=44941 RepID=A0A397U6G4_9GLOM|nr:Cupredoxin [Gigaspora rosea]
MYSYYKSATTKMMLCILVSCFFIPLSTYAADVAITVGPGLIFTPQNVSANQGDRIVWTFAGGNHDVAQTDGPAGACTKSANSSAFQSLVSPTTPYSVTVNQSSGNLYYMCTVDSHCQSGMWGVILVGGGSTPSGTAASPSGSTSSTPSGGSSPSNTPPKSSGAKNVNSNVMMIFGTVFIYILAFSSGML